MRRDGADGAVIQFARQLATVSQMTTKLVTRDLGMKIRAASLDVNTVFLKDEPSGP